MIKMLNLMSIEIRLKSILNARYYGTYPSVE